MLEKLIRRGLADRAVVSDRIRNVGGIPVDDGGDDEIEAGRTELLRLVGPVGDTALLERADRLGQKVPLLGFVKPGLAAATERGAFQPVEHEQCPFDATDLSEREIELVLALIG